MVEAVKLQSQTCHYKQYLFARTVIAFRIYQTDDEQVYTKTSILGALSNLGLGAVFIYNPCNHYKYESKFKTSK